MVDKGTATVKLLQNYWWIQTERIAGLAASCVHQNFPERNSVRPAGRRINFCPHQDRENLNDRLEYSKRIWYKCDRASYI